MNDDFATLPGKGLQFFEAKAELCKPLRLSIIFNAALKRLFLAYEYDQFFILPFL